MKPADLVVIGGGIMGCAAALHAAQAGMSVGIMERAGLAGEASGVNAGTLSLQIKRVAFIPHTLEGLRWWARAGDAIGYRRTGGYTLAFDEREQALLEERMALKIAAGAPIRFVSAAEARAAEPALGPAVCCATYCPEDGQVDSTRVAAFLRNALRAAGVMVVEHSAVRAISHAASGFTVVGERETLRGRRLLLAAGAWTGELARQLGVLLPVQMHANTVSVTECAARMLATDLGHATGLLTLKQKANGSFLIGGGWQGRVGTARGDVDAGTLAANLRLARLAVPALGSVRLLRSWTGIEGHVADNLPLAGGLPGVADAFVLACVRGGFAVGPGIASAVVDQILEREPRLPLFDPGRFAPHVMQVSQRTP